MLQKLSISPFSYESKFRLITFRSKRRTQIYLLLLIQFLLAKFPYRFLKMKKSFLFIYMNKRKKFFQNLFKVRDFVSFLSVSTLNVRIFML